MRTHKKILLASQTQTYTAADTKLYLQIDFFNMFLLDIDRSCFLNLICMQFFLFTLSYFVNKSIVVCFINITFKNLLL